MQGSSLRGITMRGLTETPRATSLSRRLRRDARVGPCRRLERARRTRPACRHAPRGSSRSRGFHEDYEMVHTLKPDVTRDEKFARLVWARILKLRRRGHPARPRKLFRTGCSCRPSLPSLRLRALCAEQDAGPARRRYPRPVAGRHEGLHRGQGRVLRPIPSVGGENELLEARASEVLRNVESALRIGRDVMR